VSAMRHPAPGGMLAAPSASAVWCFRTRRRRGVWCTATAVRLGPQRRCQKRRGMTTYPARKVTAMLRHATLAPARCGSVKGPLMRWRWGPRVCHASWPSLVCMAEAEAGTGSERSTHRSLPWMRMGPGSSSGTCSRGRWHYGVSRWRCSQRQPMGGARTSVKPGRRGCWR
jgi:hypothetical protein